MSEYCKCDKPSRSYGNSCGKCGKPMANEGSRGETPRTNDEILYDGHGKLLCGTESVLASFARQLERENQQLQLRAERAEQLNGELYHDLKRIRQMMDCDGSDFEQLQTAWLSLQSKLAAAERELRQSKVLDKAVNEIVENQKQHIDTLSQHNQVLREALPKPQPQGFDFGTNLWLSYDALAGWNGDDEAARERWCKTSIIAQGVLAYKAKVEKALSSTTPSTDWVKRSEAEKILKPALMALAAAQVGACNCGTKTPDPDYHAESCAYKGYRVAYVAAQSLLAKAQP